MINKMNYENLIYSHSNILQENNILFHHLLCDSAAKWTGDLAINKLSLAYDKESSNLLRSRFSASITVG